MTSPELTLKIASTLGILFPIICTLLRMKEAGILGRLFLIFLCAGLATDLCFWYLYYHPVEGINWYLFEGYSIIEALFFFWLIGYLAESPVIRRLALFLGAAAGVLWLVCFVVPLLHPELKTRMAFFDTVYEVAVSFLAGSVMLQLAERHDRLSVQPAFWFMLALFFYCFCTFFVMTFLGSQLALVLWPVNNIVNLLTYAGYSLGILLWRKSAL